jgi:hypothetical protein
VAGKKSGSDLSAPSKIPSSDISEIEELFLIFSEQHAIISIGYG